MYHASCDNPVTTCRASHLRRRPVRIDAATIGHMPANSPDHLFTLPRSHRSGGHHQSQFGARGFLHHFPTAPSIESRNTNRMFHSLCEKADVPQLRVHDLRHSCATLLFNDGGPACNGYDAFTPAFGFPRQGLAALGAITVPSRLSNPQRSGLVGQHGPAEAAPAFVPLADEQCEPKTCMLLDLAEAGRGVAVAEIARQPRRNLLRSLTTSSTGSRSRDRTVSSVIRSRARRIARSLGQRARNSTPRLPWVPRERTIRW